MTMGDLREDIIDAAMAVALASLLVLFVILVAYALFMGAGCT